MTIWGQCVPRSNFFYGEMLPNNGCGNFASYGPFGPGEYFRMPVLSGGSYTISTCGNNIDTQITGYQGNVTNTSIFYNDDNGPHCTALQASVTITPNFTDYTRVNVNQYNCAPGGSASITVMVRQNNNLNITSSSSDMCQGQTRTLTATPTPVTTTPQPNSGDAGTFSGAGVSGSTFTAPTPSGGSQVYTIDYDFGYCNTTQNITVFKAPASAAAGPNQTVCASTATLGGNTPAAGSGMWSVVSGPGSVSNPSSPFSGVTGLSSSTPTTFRWTISNGPCTASTDDVIIYRDADPTTAAAGNDQQICGDSTTITANTPGVGTGQWSLVGGSGSISSPNSATTAVTNLGTGANTFRWTITNGVCNPSTDDVVITVDALPTVAAAGPDQSICDTNSAMLGNAPSTGTGAWAVVSGSGNFSSGSDPNANVTGLSTGSNIITWTISNGVCPSSVDTMEIFVKTPPAPPSVTGDTSICAGQTATLYASSGASSPSYAWYDSLTGGTQLATGVNYTTQQLFANTIIFAEVTSGVTNCASERTPVMIVVNQPPPVSAGTDTTVCADKVVCYDAGPGYIAYIWSTGDTSQSTCPAAPGPISVTVTDTNGCQSSDTVNLTHMPLPMVNLGNDTSYCQGGSVTLDAGVAGISYLWSNGDTTQTTVVSAAGMVSVIGTDTNNCSNTDTVGVSEAAVPVAGFGIDSTDCPNMQFADSTAGNPSTWSWDFGDGSGTSAMQSPMYSYTNNGVYTIQLISSNPCGVDTMEKTITVNCIVGTDPIQFLPNVVLYPNPSNGQFAISFTNVKKRVDLVMFDAAGRMVFEQVIKQKGEFTQPFNMTSLAKGEYIIKMKVDGQTLNRRIVLQ